MITLPPVVWFANLHFVLAVVSAFAFFGAGALYVDSAVVIRQSPLLFTRATGFFLLASWSAIHGFLVAAGVPVPASVEGLQTLALVVVAGTYLTERLPGRPAGPQKQAAGTDQPEPQAERRTNRRRVAALLALPPIAVTRALGPLLAFLIAGRLWYQAMVKLERARRGLAVAFTLYVLSWALEMVRSWPGGPWSVLLGGSAAEPFGLLWGLARVAETLGAAFLLAWVFRYLRFRLFPQLYLTVVGVVLVATLAVTVVLSLALARSTQVRELAALETNAQVFAFTLEELKAQVSLVAALLARTEGLATAVAENDPARTRDLLDDPVRAHGIGAATVLNDGGEVLHAVGGALRRGESASNDPTVVRAFRGTTVASVVVADGPEVLTVVVRATEPLVRDGEAVGAVLVDMPVDAAFLDGVQQLTGLTLVVFGGDRVAATTLRGAENRPPLGIVGESAPILTAVQERGEYRGRGILGARPYLVAATPLRDVDNELVGALVVGLPETEFLRGVDAATRVGLLSALVVLLVSLLPLFWVARVIARYQLV